MIGLFSKLKNALTKTSNRISAGIEHVFLKKKLDENALIELEEILISSDIGAFVASNVVEKLRKAKFNSDITSDEVKNELVTILTEILDSVDHNFAIEKQTELQVIVVCGVNGNGKTTSIGKLANFYKSLGKSVAVAACDTFRAAAIEQLETWTNRANVKLFKGSEKADPASVAHIAVSESLQSGIDILFIDTAGRLHNHKNLMEELAKINRVIAKILPNAPHHTLLVIDGTTGQNAFVQTEQFQKIAGVTGLVITKLDGTAKAGVVIGIVDKYHLPVHFIGVGEGINDLKPFSSDIFARAIIGTQESE